VGQNAEEVGPGPEQPNGLWSVVDQQFVTEVTQGGRFLEQVEVRVRTASGVEIPLKINRDDYGPEVVTMMANAWSEGIERVSRLGNPQQG
jgi:hypothetical protein